jgi:hypothetical protein
LRRELLGSSVDDGLGFTEYATGLSCLASSVHPLRTLNSSSVSKGAEVFVRAGSTGCLAVSVSGVSCSTRRRSNGCVQAEMAEGAFQTSVRGDSSTSLHSVTTGSTGRFSYRVEVLAILTSVSAERACLSFDGRVGATRTDLRRGVHTGAHITGRAILAGACSSESISTDSAESLGLTTTATA